MPITKEQLESIYSKITESVTTNWDIAGYFHGDTHLDNLFFDSLSEQFSFIDTPSFLGSIDSKGRPIGFPAYDFAWTLESISDKGFRSGLTSQEVGGLQSAFKGEYEKSMGEYIAPPPTRQFALLTKQLYFIQRANQNQEFLLDNASNVPNMQEEFDNLQRLIDHTTESLRTLI